MSRDVERCGKGSKVPENKRVRVKNTFYSIKTILQRLNVSTSVVMKRTNPGKSRGKKKILIFPKIVTGHKRDHV